MIVDILKLIVFASISFFAFFGWTAIHELSHWLAAKALKIKVGDMRILPHKLNGKHVLGSVMIFDKVTNAENVIISQAPQFINILAVCTMPLFFMYSSWELIWASAIWYLIIILGLCGFIEGCYDSQKGSDLDHTVRALNVSPWIFRIIGTIFIISISIISILAMGIKYD